VSDLDLIYELDIIYNEITIKEKELERLNNRLEINKTEEEKKRYIIELDNLNNLLNDKHSILRKKENELKDYKYKLNNLKDSYEKTNVKDTKQYEYFISSINNLENRIDLLESEILELMISEDKISNNIIRVKEKIKEISDEIVNLYDANYANVEILKKEIEALQKEVLEIRKKITISKLSEYEKIKYRKKRAVAEVKDKACTSCGMILPTSYIDFLKKSDDIIVCENCGSILYINKE